MNYITKFNNKSAYDSAKSSLVKPNLSLVGGEIFYAPRDYKFGDYLHSDGHVDNIAASDVIGICVIPSSHYGKARFMSVVKMSASSTSGTTSDETMTWGPSPDNNYIPPKGFTTKCVGTDLYNGNSNSFIEDSPYAVLPTDRLHGGYSDDGYQTPSKPDYWDQSARYWYDEGDESIRYIPSPFKNNGDLNPDFRKAWPNVLADIDGEINTNAILAIGNNYPAAKACRDFNPGFGAWYLPAAGELAYLVPRWGAINDKLTALSNAGCRVATLGEYDYFWSSSAYSPYRSWLVGMYVGYVGNYGRYDYDYVLAFSAL